MTDLEKLIKQARAKWGAMSPQEREVMAKQQAKSFATAEAGFGSDADEAAMRDALRKGDVARIEELQREEQQRVAAAKKLGEN